MRTLVVGEGDADFKGTERFEVVRRIGSGGMGVVYEAFDRELRAPVALKVLRTLEPETLFRFKNEFRVLEGIRHRNLIHLGELFEEEGRWFFTMELVHGKHFLDYLEQTGPRSQGSSFAASSMAIDPLEVTMSDTQRISGIPTSGPLAKRSRLDNEIDEEKLRDALRQLAEGLYALHHAKRVHRDIKPSNILVTPEGRVVILDFGLAVDLEASLPEAYLVGTCWYMAPEQARLRPIGPAADWYSVGVLLYQALTGRLPIQGNAREVLYMKQFNEPAPPSEIAVVPEDLNALCVELLRIEPKDRPEGREILRRLGVDVQALSTSDADVPHFVGRQGELSELQSAFAAARDQGGVSVFIHGESGVGKSAIVRRFCEIVAARDASALVLSGRCYEREAVPYKAVDGVIDALSRALASLEMEEIAEILPTDVGLLGLIFPVLRRIEPVSQATVPPLGSLEPTLLRARLFRALRELLEGLAELRPVIVAIDDLQWADADSLALLAEIMRPPGAPRLLLVVTMRAALRSEASTIPTPPSAESPVSHARGPHSAIGAPSSSPGELSVMPLRVQQIERLFQGEVRSMHIEGLPQKDAQALVEALLQASSAAGDSSAAALAQEAGGHPLFIDELVRGRLMAGGGKAPLRLEDALWARIAKLEPEARRALDLIVAAGAPLDQDTAARAAGVEFNDFSEQVALLRAENLVRTSGARRADAVETYHDRVREAVLLHQSQDAQKSLHDRLAVALEESGSADPEALAFHYRRAGKLDKAAEHAARAAEIFENALAFDRAAALYQLSLDLRPLEGPLGGAMRAKLADALANAGKGALAAAAYLEAATEVPASEALDLKRRAADQLLRTGHIDEAMDAFRSVLSAIDMEMPETPRSALASLLLRRAQVRLRGLRFTERPESEIPLQILTRFDVCWSVAAGLGLVDTIVGRYFQARCLLLALEAGEPHRIARALAMEASYSSASGGHNKARTQRLIEATEALAYRVNHPYALGWAAGAAGIAGCLEGRWRSGHACCERAEATFRDNCTGVYWEIGTMQWFSMWSQCYLGQLDELSRRIPTRLREAAERGDLYAAIGHSTGLANLVWLAADQVDLARERSREAMRKWSQRRFHVEHWWAMLGDRQIELYVGDAEAAYRAVHAQWDALKGSLLLMVQLTKTEATHLRARAALMLAEGRPSERKALCGEAARDAKSIAAEKMPWSDPLAALLRAGIANVRGDADRALAELQQAEAGLVAADMALYAAAARYCRGKLLGGDAGNALVNASLGWMSGQGVVNPERMVALHAPGFSGDGMRASEPAADRVK